MRRELQVLGITLTSNGRDDVKIKNKIQKDKTIIINLPSILWNNRISKNNKGVRYIYREYYDVWIRRVNSEKAMIKDNSNRVNVLEML